MHYIKIEILSSVDSKNDIVTLHYKNSINNLQIVYASEANDMFITGAWHRISTWLDYKWTNYSCPLFLFSVQLLLRKFVLSLVDSADDIVMLYKTVYKNVQYFLLSWWGSTDALVSQQKPELMKKPSESA